jgi:hypothetical protein
LIGSIHSRTHSAKPALLDLTSLNLEWLDLVRKGPRSGRSLAELPRCRSPRRPSRGDGRDSNDGPNGKTAVPAICFFARRSLAYLSDRSRSLRALRLASGHRATLFNKRLKREVQHRTLAAFTPESVPIMPSARRRIDVKRNPSTRAPALALAAALLSSFLWVAPAKSSGPDHLYWADLVAANVAPQNNTYASNPSYVHWLGVDGYSTYENRSKCASFVTSILMQSYGWTGTDFKTWMASTSPTADKYYNAITQQNGFYVIGNVNDIVPGDIFAIKYPSGSTVTGHLMVARGVAVPRTSSAPIIDGTYQYEIQVIDSSQSGHGPTDTRRNADGTYNPGAGIGVLRLYVDSAGALVGYTWSTYSNSQFYDSSTRPIVVGRLY